MPPSHQRHRRSPFKRTSFRRASSGSSSLRSVSEIQFRSDDHVKLQFSHPKMPGWENGDVLIRNADTDKHSATFHPTVTVTACRDEMAVMRMDGRKTSQAQSQSQILRCENTKGEMEERDTSPAASSIYSTNTLGYPTTDPDKDVDNGSYTSCSSIPRVPGLSLETLNSRSAVSDISFLNAEGERDYELGESMASSRMERWKTFGKARGKVRGYLRSGKARDENGDRDGGGDESKNGKEKHGKHEKKIRPFLRKYCLHPLSMRSSFRLVGWIEDPVGCCVGHGAGYGIGCASGYGEVRTGYTYGGGIGDARIWDEARRSGLEGGLY